MAADCFWSAESFALSAVLADEVFVDDEAAEELADFVAGAFWADPFWAVPVSCFALEPDEALAFAGDAEPVLAAVFVDAWAAGLSAPFAAGAEPLVVPAPVSWEESLRPSK